ncbi:MAG: 30S ribosomal protein S16 [Chloroflexota bacterium]
MVRIRLTRVGSKKQPSYRIVVTDKRNARDSKSIENIGFYNPRTRPSTESIDEERALYWLSVGAQPSDAVNRILKRLGTLERFARLKAGEDMEALVKEADENRADLPDPRTQFPAPADGESKIKAREAARLAAEEAAAAEAAAAEAEAADEDEEETTDEDAE